MKNSEAVQKSIDYFMGHYDKQDLATLLSHAWLDVYRLYCLEDLTAEQRRCLLFRMKKNTEMFSQILSGEIQEPFVMKHIKSPEEA